MPDERIRAFLVVDSDASVELPGLDEMLDRGVGEAVVDMRADAERDVKRTRPHLVAE